MAPYLGPFSVSSFQTMWGMKLVEEALLFNMSTSFTYEALYVAFIVTWLSEMCLCYAWPCVALDFSFMPKVQRGKPLLIHSKRIQKVKRGSYNSIYWETVAQTKCHTLSSHSWDIHVPPLRCACIPIGVAHTTPTNTSRVIIS